jgi:hypothetical protein
VSGTKAPENPLPVPQASYTIETAARLAGDANDRLAMEDIIVAALAEDSTLLEAWMRNPPRKLSRKARFFYWKRHHIWQPIHDWAARKGAYCDEW